MFDVFYWGTKPNLFEFEKPAASIDEAAAMSRTGFYWYIYGGNDYSKFDFAYRPVPWEKNQIHVWPSQWQRDGGVYLAHADTAQAREWNFHTDQQVQRLPNPSHDHWFIPNNIDRTNFDFSWHPDPHEPDYEYHFGTQWQSAGGPVWEGTAGVKLMDVQRATSVDNRSNWNCPAHIVDVKYSWHPNPLEPAYIYHFADQWQPASGLTYTVPGATEIKLVADFRVRALPNKQGWVTPDIVADFDYSWHPNPLDPVYVHEFGTQWYNEGGPVFAQPSATEYKYHEEPKARLSATGANWKILHKIVNNSFDFSWAPHPREEPYIYVWGNQYWPAEKMPTVEYHVPGATQRKYMEGVARLAPNYENWITPGVVDESSVDYAWVPDPQDPPFIYEFATQWQPNGGPTYTVPGATQRKYVGMVTRRKADHTHHWSAHEDISNFDYSWHPDNAEEPYIYVFGNQHYPGTIMPTVRYTVEGATKEKFVDLPVATLCASMDNWEILEDIDMEAWDWTWVPNPKDPPYIYVFGNQWNPPEYKPSVKYTVPGATEIKYMDRRTVRKGHPELFQTTELPVAEFDYSWEPNPFDPPFNYVFGNQWNSAVLEPTLIYQVAGATEIKYVDDIVATLHPQMTNWRVLDQVAEFDFSWRPNPKDPAYIYVFGNQWLSPEQRPAVQYVAPGATEIKYMDEPKAWRQGHMSDFDVKYFCDFDWSWEPDPGSPPYIYVFGNQWYPAEIMPTVEFTVEGATERKFMSEPVAMLQSNDQYYAHPHPEHKIEFDYSWRPEPGSPPYIYVFGNQHWPATQMSTVEYHAPGATEIKYMDSPRATILPNEDNWLVPEEIVKDNIDFSWIPDPAEPPYIYHFGTEFQMSVGLTYTVATATELKFAGDMPLKVKEKKAIDVLDIFFIDKSNLAAQPRFNRLKDKYPKIQKVRYANSIMDTIQRCVTRAKTNKFWIISSEYSYDRFNFEWHAQPWQSYMTHVFPSQHNKWSDTFLINKWEFERHAKWAKSLEEFPNLNFVKDQDVVKTENLNNMYYVDHANAEAAAQLSILKKEYPEIINTRFVDNYLDTMKRIMSTATTEHVWILNSVCDYSYFDFTWQPEPWQKEMIHCFSNGTEINNSELRGDTFYIHVESFKAQMIELELLDWFNVINYVVDQRVNRYPIPAVYYKGDNLIEAVKNHNFTGPYALFTNSQDYAGVKNVNTCLWTEKDRTVREFNRDKSISLVPRDVKRYLKTQMYDYPYLDSDKVRNVRYTPDLDIIYISNGEPDEQKWFEHTEYMSNRNVKWVRGVNGRVAAYQEAARQSSTNWFFAVFAKLEVAGGSFPWDWQPDYWQGPKHYIFNAQNPVNGLVYGHQGMIAYNKSLVLANNDPGIDFTLSQPHESVPILSGVAHYNQDAWTTWRTAFREALKLRLFMDTQPTLETEHRLETWRTVAAGNYSNYSIDGANDAVAYYEEVQGDLAKLQLSFEWAWLRNRYDAKY